MSQSPDLPDFLPDSLAEPESGSGPTVKNAGLSSGPFATENHFFGLLFGHTHFSDPNFFVEHHSKMVISDSQQHWVGT